MNALECQPAVRKILVPMDLSYGSVKALEYALSLARKSHASVIVLHAVQLNIAGEELGIPRTKLLSEMGEKVRVQIQHLVEALTNEGSSPQIVIAEGRPHQEILDQAQRPEPDLIVMAGRRHTGLGWLLRPNTVARVLKHARCPVVLLAPNEWD